MGYFLTVLYILTAYVTPETLFGPLGQYHLEIIIVSLAVVFSIPNLLQSARVVATWQAFAVVAFGFVIFISVALHGWFGGAVSALYGTLPTLLGFFLVAINCKRKWHFQFLVLTLVVSSIILILFGMLDLHNQVVPSLYLYGDGTLRRIRGLGFVNDPNDFAQAMVSLLPAVFLWKRPGLLSNIFLVGLPICMLLAGLYLTHSRGAIMALAAVILISARRKLGTLPASLLAGLLLVGGLAAGWSGGRDVSMEGGADRLDLWAAGLQMIKAHPLFGVGAGGFADANGITAHNSVVICAAETGILGLFCWTMFLLCSIREGVLYERALSGKAAADTKDADSPVPWRTSPVPGASQREDAARWRNPGVTEAATLSLGRSWTAVQPYPRTVGHASVHASSTTDLIMPVEQNTMGRSRMAPSKEMTASQVSDMIKILIASITGFLTAGWFLSRAVSLWLFMYCGMLYAACQIATESGVLPQKDSKGFILGRSFAVTIGLLVLVSVILRLRNVGL